MATYLATLSPCFPPPRANQTNQAGQGQQRLVRSRVPHHHHHHQHTHARARNHTHMHTRTRAHTLMRTTHSSASCSADYSEW